MESDEELVLTPPEITEIARNIEVNLLPEKSRKQYEQAYRRFMDYRNKNAIRSFSESVLLVYFAELSKAMKASRLWSIYSMLRTTVNVNHNIDMSKYLKLRAFLKRQSEGFRAKKSKVFNREEIEKFLQEAPDDNYLITKVVLTFGIAGACRCGELVQIKLNDIVDMGNKLIISLPDTKTKRPRTFVISEHLDIYRKYCACRPLDIENQRFFFKYANGKGFRQFVGIHKIGQMPEEIATFLNLPNAKEYTGHCFRRSSATILYIVDSGGDITLLKRHAGWKSTSTAEGYIEDSIASKEVISGIIFSNRDETYFGVDVAEHVAHTTSSNEKNGALSNKGENVSSVGLVNTTILDQKKMGNLGGAITVQNCSNFTINIHNDKI